MKLPHRTWMILAAAPIAAGAVVQSALAADTAATTPSTHAVSRSNDHKSDARDTLQEALKVVNKMQSDPGMRPHLQKAKGVFIVPNFARGAAVVGIKGGEGVMLSRKDDGQWTNPAFYNMGAVSVGAQAGASAGQIAFLLMDDKAVKVFNTKNTFSLNADAGLSIGNYSARGEASAGKGDDVIAWSDTEGLFAGVSISVGDIVADNGENRAYYGSDSATAQALLHGNAQVSHTPAEARSLKQALAGKKGGTPTASNAGMSGSPAKARHDENGSTQHMAGSSHS